jgi:cobalt/nickel transport system permease protein
VHISSDSLLSPVVLGTCAVLGGGAVLAASARANRRLAEQHVPLLGVSGAFVFAAQMLNFPVPGGTSGHFLGGALVGLLLGPAAAVLVLAAVLVIQCFVFGDGSPFALGANLVNLGLLGGGVGGLGRAITRRATLPDVHRYHRALGFTAFVTGWLSSVLGAVACAGELALSGTLPGEVAVPAMAALHAFIGIGEGAISLAAIALLARVRPDLLELEAL